MPRAAGVPARAGPPGLWHNAGMRRKLAVADLKLGMYVAELDRPWLDSPFPFQGFVIETDEQLVTLRRVCQYVVVDNEQLVGRRPERRREEPPAAKDAVPATAAAIERTDLTALGWRGRGAFRQDLQQFLESREKVLRHMTQLLEDARLGRSLNLQQTRELVEEVVEVVAANHTTALWLKNLGTRHESTATHSLGVCVFSVVFGSHLGLSRDSLTDLGLGALLHDVGKMRTPVSILDKPSLLTEDEFDIMRKHPMDGFHILRKHKDVPDKALEIVQLHHERIGGQGYPFGLRGDEIPVHVRIVAIADVYDDITSERVYHEGIPAHTGLNMMFHWAPRDFGEDLMQEFIRCIGIYPIGSLVELSNGALGIVMSTNPASRLRPIVMMVRDPEGRAYTRRPLINLAAPRDKDDSGLAIRRVVDSREFDIDIAHIAELEAGRKR